MNRPKRKGTDVKAQTIRVEKCEPENEKVEAIFRGSADAEQGAHNELAKARKQLEGLRKKLDGRLNGNGTTEDKVETEDEAACP